MNRFLAVGMLLAATAVSACETMQGAGRDMQTAGQLLTQQAAESQTQVGSYAPPGPAVTPMPY
ncbi:entericidin A/B family lipoprotein [Paracoccus aminovorans]|uniref:entericidin A/B family lipoprotein n=1 Tax=Paracoccus aminovorans TaxID=34004 RepID=UPI002B25FD82|nr:entericidin A/B family lipoprotein [Paracoccus aminovorans]